MNWVDYAILAIIGLSALISLVRGFVREVISILIWVAAFWLSVLLAPRVGALLAGSVESPTLQVGLGFAIVFVGVLFLGAIVSFLANTLVDKTGLTGTDRLAGIFFGIARGVLIVSLLVLVVGLTSIPRHEPSWKGSVLVAQLQPLVCTIGVQDWMADLKVYSPLSKGDSGTPAPGYWADFCSAVN
jgi:membrane protein required for colicin V production